MNIRSLLRTDLFLTLLLAMSVLAIATAAPSGELSAQDQSQEFPPGPVITLQLANMEELCTAANLDQYGSTRNYIRAITLNIRLLPGEDKSDAIIQCARDLEGAGQAGLLPHDLLRLVIGWVQMSCIGLRDMGFVDMRTCAEVREIRNRNF